MYIIESKVKMLSPDGLSRMWDKDANGYARGEGVAAVMLKTLSQALADGDDIECIIRETGVNQDGATGGITMPSASAQQALIQRVYAKAGLDPQNNPAHRPQYIEAHGTGTPAGDPVEAEALSAAFFRPGEDSRANPIYAGSVKTVLGHTEGTAGLAGLLKACVALRNSTIPPNLLFHELAPNVAPFYGNLQITTAAKPWPQPSDNQPRRASVNNFGFGGTNAHAIVESYSKDSRSKPLSPSLRFMPFVFSAASEDALRASLTAYAQFLADNPETDLSDLAYTLSERRSIFSYRAAFIGQTVQQLVSNISAALESSDDTDASQKTSLGTHTRPRSKANPVRIFGIFTGQGAQYARMGAELIELSPMAGQIIATLEKYLEDLGEANDKPVWSLTEELLAAVDKSRVGEASISQPLCTAIQIMMVDLLAAAGVHFNAVVGHSSGEIAAAYAAGYLSARDAMLVAYYRGLHCKHAASPNGGGAIKGAMLAAGTSEDDAVELCESEELKGRVSVAAVNSSSSVTFSGDEDAIDELATLFEDEKKFHRKLRVDQAYHSAHMLPCSAPYMAALHKAGVKAKKPEAERGCIWYSSVYDGRPIEDADLGQLGDEYWAKNMTQSVRFFQAVSAAVQGSPSLSTVIEVGAHPALKGPASQNIQEVLSKALHYFGTLSRSVKATDAWAICLGALWTTTLDSAGAAVPSLGQCEKALRGDPDVQFNVLKALPTYKWKHQTRHWAESRRSRKLRLRDGPFHPLLGDASPDSAPHLLRWKNVLKPVEIPWVQGHQVQGQIVLPAAAYVSSAVEAAQFLVEKDKRAAIEMIELKNFHIHNPIMFDTDDAAVEVQIELSQVVSSSTSTGSSVTTAKFIYSAALPDSDLDLAAQGEVCVRVGTPSPALLPKRQETPPHVIPVDPDRLYGFMASLEYDFSGPFKSLTKLQRKLGKATCEAKRYREDPDILLHPVDLDAAFQSVMLAYSYPGDGQLRLLHLPTTIDLVRVNPTVLRSTELVGDDMAAVNSICSPADRASPGSGFSGSVSMYPTTQPTTGTAAAVQVEQVQFKPVGSSDAKNDRNVFYNMNWVLARPNGELAAQHVPITPRDKELMWVLSRIAAYYLRQFDTIVPADSPLRQESNKGGPEYWYLRYARHMTELLTTGKHQWAHHEWVNDKIEDVREAIVAKGFTESSDVQIMLLVGETMPRVFAGETTMLQHFRESGLLDKYYAEGFGTKQTVIWVGEVVKQLTDRNPHLRLLEIGAGTGGATQSILRTIGTAMEHYTFTDISSSFFENAAAKFAEYGDRMTFKVCNAEIDPLQQGFEAGTYDVVIAFMVVHACAKLDEAMTNLRKLLKPGGMLILGEGAADGAMQAGAGFIFGPLSGWWRGAEEGRTLSPLVNVSEWESILKRTGFSGIDTMSPPKMFEAFGITLFVSTAVDERVAFALAPLAVDKVDSKVPKVSFKRLVVLGGQTAVVADLVQKIKMLVAPMAAEVLTYTTLEDIATGALDGDVHIISLVDLESPVFQEITEKRWYSFRNIFASDKTVLWLTSGRLADNPFANMTVGFGRSAMHEEDTLHVQYLDVPSIATITAEDVVSRLLRFTAKELHTDDKKKATILYTQEPEILIDADGYERVPRLFPMDEANHRINSATRSIFKETRLEDVAVVELVQASSDGAHLRELTRYETDEKLMPIAPLDAACSIDLHITHALQCALRTPVGYRFLVMGLARGSNKPYISLTSTLTSLLRVPNQAALAVEELDKTLAGLPEQALLFLVAADMMALAVVEPLFCGQRLVLHNSPKVFADAVKRLAVAKGVQVSFLADAGYSIDDPATVRLPRFLGGFEITQVVQHGQPPDCFVGLSMEYSENEASILSGLPEQCRVESSRTLVALAATKDFAPSATASILGQLLKKVANNLMSDVDMLQNLQHVTDASSSSLVDLEAIIRPTEGEHQKRSLLSVIKWAAVSPTLPCRVTRIENQHLFKGDKTYWLVGLSGALGISLCDWMIERGVKYLVLTSRNPKIDPRWVQDHAQRNGVVIQILCCDVTNEEAIKAVHRQIVDTLPPIIGLLNGAMVLRDVSVRNMEFEHVTDVIRPKVLGSIHLDRIFHDVDLDFFVLLSSINCVIGNVGQANYAAANMGMIGVAGQRRKRGLRSSVVNVGAIIGVGYITQSDRQLDVTVAKTAMMHLSEQDFHQIFAECMEAGHLDNPAGPEISTGLLDVVPESINIPPWYSDPKFARFIVTTRSTDDKKQQSSRSDGANIADRLLACCNEQQVRDVILEAFGAQLRRILQISMSDEELMSMRGVELGFDSLISVDIRSWFLKNFQVSIPVLKIMASDVHMSSLVDLALEGIPEELVPQGKSGGANSPRSESESGSSKDSSSNAPSSLGTPASEVTLSSVDEMARSATAMRSVSDTGAKVDWDTETIPPTPDSFLSYPQDVQPVDQGKTPQVVVLTGCSGLLGHHLLDTLLAHSSICKVICLATRRLAERVANKEIPAPSERIVYYEGDLTAERFGLSEAEWVKVFSEVDAVIHNGSDTSHLKYYTALRQANVESTRQLLRACIPRQIPLHYVSSAGVALFAELEAFPPISCTKTGRKPPADGSHGYMCGKWVCENMLERLHKSYPQQRIVIQRPSTIIRQGDDAEVAKAGFDWVNALLHYCHKTKTVPRVDHNSGAFDLVSIQTCCDDVKRELLRSRTDSGIVYVNNVGDIVIDMNHMAEMGKERGAGLYEVVPMSEWTRIVIEAGLHPAVAALIEVFDEPGAERYPRLLKA